MSDQTETFTDRHGNEWNTKPGRRRVAEEKADEKMEVHTHFPPEAFDGADTRKLKRWLTHGESCPMKRTIISHNAVEDFGATLDSDRDFRIECPHCGRGVGVDVNKDGVARIATHVLPDNDPNPHHERFRYDGDGEWSFYDPANDPDDE